MKFKYKPVIERLKERELKRTFPRLKVQPVYIRKFNAASEGCSVNNAEKKTIQAELISKDNKIYIDAEFKENGLIPVKFMLIDTNNNITCVRETTKEERQSGTICEDFIEWKEKIEPYGRYLMAAEAVESAFSSSYIVPFVNTEWGKQADSLIETFLLFLLLLRKYISISFSIHLAQ